MEHQEEFPRHARMGDFLGLINSTGLLSDSGGRPIFHRIEFIEQVPEVILQGPADLAAATPTAIADAQIQRLEMPSNELLQVRFAIGIDVAVLTAGADIEVTMAQLRATNRWVTSRVQGRWSLIQQGFVILPALAGAAPVLNTVIAAATVPATYSLAQFWQTEHNIFEDDTPVYTVENVGPTAVAGGCRIDLHFTGWRYVLSIAQPQDDWVEQTIFGRSVLGPRFFTRVPITGVGR